MNRKHVNLPRCVGRLKCGDKQGTAFFVSVDLAITCRHCITSHLTKGTEIAIHVEGKSITAEIAEPDIPVEHDTVLLKLSTPIPDDLLIPLVASHLPPKADWETFGFPLVRAENGMALEGVVARSLYSDNVSRDVELNCSATDLPTEFRGFSGSPVILGGAVRAVLQIRLDGGLGAISLAQLHSYLEDAGIKFRSAKNQSQLPPALRQELSESVPNRKTLWQLEESVTESRQGYILLEGNPGAGKTLVMASFQPATRELAVAGHYFASGHIGSEMPLRYYGRLATFAHWLSNEVSLRSSEAEAVPLDSTDDQLSESIVANLETLGKTAETNGLVVLLIDGVDPVQGAVIEFIDSLPNSPPPGLRIIISTPNATTFKARFDNLNIADEVITQPLPHYDCEQVVMKRLAHRLNPSQAADLARLSEGHPLTLSYLIKESGSALDRGEFDPISSIEPFHGGLDAYYAKVWTRLSKQGDAQYLLSLIARFRQSILQSQLPQILPSNQQAGFLSTFDQVSHLLRVDHGVIKFYHESFRDYVITQSEVLSNQIHQVIARYCEADSGSEYAVAHGLYHHMRCGNISQATSFLCTQEWVDQAALSCVHPEHVISDINEILANRLKNGDLKESIRLLLLRSRTLSRYNRVFVRFAHQLARATVGIRSPRQALGFVIREGQFLCSPDETLTLFRTLIVDGHHEEAIELFQEFRRRSWAAYEQGVANYDVLLAHMHALCIVGPSVSQPELAFVAGELRELFHLFQTNLENTERDEDSKALMLSQVSGALYAEQLWRCGFAACTSDDPVELAYLLEKANSLAWEHGYLEPYEEPPTLLADTGDYQLLNREEIAKALKCASVKKAITSGAEELVASVLMRVSDAFDRVGELYTLSVLPDTSVSFRSKNGVDPELSSISTFLFSHEVAAYTSNHMFSLRVTSSVRHEWERRFFDATSWIGEERGLRFRARALGTPILDTLIQRMKADFFPSLSFSLQERAQWEDSYHLPEYVLPRLMLFAAEAIVEFEPESASEFSNTLLDHSENQLGLYTEGYRRLLSVVADVLASTPQGIQPAADLRRTLCKHVKKCVFQREQRVVSLLNSASHFARLDALTDAENTFEEAIRSSLGPTWYKEDQFRLLMDAIEAVDDKGFTLSQWRKTIEVFAFASGESTFQRFVRQQKERLIRHLANSGLLAEALASYQHYVLPTLQLQRSRVTRVGVDMTSALSGDRFGVLEIDEQSGVLTLLSGTRDASPLRRWAVLELFWPWGDERYGEEFAWTCCELLITDNTDEIGERFVRLLGAEVEPSKRDRFASLIRTIDKANVASPWIQVAEDRGVSFSSEEASVDTSPIVIPDQSRDREKPEKEQDNSELLVPGLFGREDSLIPLKEAKNTAQERIDRGDVSGASQILVGALQEAQQGSWNVWVGHPDADTALRLLFASCGSIETSLGSLADFIMEEKHAISWEIAASLISVALQHLDSGNRCELFDILAEHIECLISAEREYLSVAEELQNLPTDLESISANECLDKLLLSQIDHPNVHMRKRAADALEWLARKGEISLQLIIDHAAKDGFSEGREVAIGLIHRFVLQSPERVQQISDCDSFMRLMSRNTFLDRFLVEEIGSIWEETGMTSPSTVTSSIMPFDWSFKADHILDLQENAREMAGQAVAELCDPMRPVEVQELMQIRLQAFAAPLPPRGYGFEREAIFRAFATYAPENSTRETLVSAVLWNPLWPDADLYIGWSPIASQILTAVESKQSLPQCSVGDKTILHYIELEPPKGEATLTMTEIVAVIVAPKVFQGKINREKLWVSLTVHQQELGPVQESVITMPQYPAIGRFEPNLAIGGDLTPALPSHQLIRLIGEDSTVRFSWRDGRRWDSWGPGPPLVRGTVTLIESSKLQLPNDLGLVWVVLRNQQPVFIINPIHNQIHEYQHEE